MSKGKLLSLILKFCKQPKLAHPQIKTKGRLCTLFQYCTGPFSVTVALLRCNLKTSYSEEPRVYLVLLFQVNFGKTFSRTHFDFSSLRSSSSCSACFLLQDIKKQKEISTILMSSSKDRQIQYNYHLIYFTTLFFWVFLICAKHGLKGTTDRKTTLFQPLLLNHL